MRISAVILRVADVAEAKSFWSEKVGLGVVFEVPNFVFLDGGGTQLVLSHIDDGVTDESMTEVVLEVDDVRDSFAALSERGVPFEVELRPVNSDGERQLLAAHFRDPDGHYASLTGWVAETA
ncbi:MAG: VOC family protein [Acidimicrobiia bacterium]